MSDTIAVLGAGSWGTALAIQLARGDMTVTMWGHNPDHIERLRLSRENSEFLPGFRLADNIRLESSLQAAVQDIDYLLIAIPSKGFRSLLVALAPLIAETTSIFWASKGFEIESGKLLHEIIAEELPAHDYGVISGPTFATEVAKGLPTAIACAGNNPATTVGFANLIHGSRFRCYTSDDVVGIELGGALKNVLAIAVGAADGLGFGANTRAALMTRGMAEIMRLGLRLDARRETLMGLAGLGDLILTCTDDQSRNRRFGLAIGRGITVSQAEIEVGQTVEGLRAAKAIYRITQTLELELPIMEQVYRVLYEDKNPMDAVTDLENRPQRAE
ncbi:MAG: NAD(P)-dependent glycerol-3-phosphate dehydrogenase [Gammaproteobacteria bacterium]|nr:MAG: NAD(P)-dependent glycerol-3-phosphate dehydrogenase [Gammaproteobacteria bacterium]